MHIKVNNQLVSPMFFRFVMDGEVTVEISPQIEGFTIIQEGEEPITGINPREFHHVFINSLRRKSTLGPTV